MNPDWHRIFPDEDHRFRMGLRPGDAQSFWRDAKETVLNERRQWLAESPDLYAGLLDEGVEVASEALDLMTGLAGFPAVPSGAGNSPLASCLHAGAMLEPDWVILNAEARVLGGVVVFPSAWSLPAKLGLPLSAVHEPVPRLEGALGRSIRAFLTRLLPGAAWQRDNWGLSADQELNHHPSRRLASITNGACISKTWLRLERQFLLRLPRTRGILFGIRVSNHRLDDLADVPGVGVRLAKALETMSDDVTQYKELQEAQAGLAAQLRAVTVDETGSDP